AAQHLDGVEHVLRGGSGPQLALLQS
ncbi:hypothetical protein SL25_05473, partial [Klebsiella pneumoniae]